MNTRLQVQTGKNDEAFLFKIYCMLIINDLTNRFRSGVQLKKNVTRKEESSESREGNSEVLG